jgi:multidrug efflux pump subunit AcrB
VHHLCDDMRFTTLNYYFVIMEVEPQFQLGCSALNRIYVGSSTGAQVPLAQFVKIVPSVAQVAVNHEGQFPSVTLSFNLSSGSSVGSAVAAIQKAAQSLHLPPAHHADHRSSSCCLFDPRHAL